MRIKYYIILVFSHTGAICLGQIDRETIGIFNRFI